MKNRHRYGRNVGIIRLEIKTTMINMLRTLMEKWIKCKNIQVM